MDTDKGYRSERTSISHNPIVFTSVGGHLARDIAPSEIKSTENGTPRHNNDFTQSFIRIKNDFLPFLNERDGMNRLISSIPSKYDPSKLSEPSNPSLYYKSDRFNIVRLRFDQAERNRKSLSKLLQFKSDESNQSNILEADKATRLHKAAAGKSLFAKNTATKWFGFEAGAQDDQPSDYLSSDRYAINIDLLEPEALLKNTPVAGVHGGLITPCLLQNLNEMKLRKTNMLSMLKLDIPENKRPQKPRIVKSKSEILHPKKKLTLPNDDFTGFVTRIDDDLRNMATYSVPLRLKTRRDMNSLQGVMKRFEYPRPPLKTQQSMVVSPKRLQIDHPLITKEFSTIPTPREATLHKRSQSDKGIIYSNPKVYKEQRRKKFIL